MFSEMPISGQNKISLNDFGFLLPVIGLFGVVYVNTKWFFIFIGILLKQSWLPSAIKTFLDREPRDVVAEFISPVRGILLIASLAVLLVLIWKSIDRENLRTVPRPRLSMVVLGCIALSVLIFPTGLAGMSFEYSDTTLGLFTKVQPINGGERFLMTALAHILFFRGPVFYVIFSLILNFIFVYCVFMWFARNNVPLSLWEFLSLGTVSFIMSQFHVQGYPDVLVHTFVLLALVLPMGTKGFLSLFALSMATHEASVFVWTILALFMLDKRSLVNFLLVLACYIFFRFASAGFDLAGTVSPRVVGDMTMMEWLSFNLWREFLGIFFAFRAGWVIIVAALVGWAQQTAWRDFLFALGLIFAGIVMTLMGVDTSRLLGWAFPVLLFSWKFLSQSENPLHKKILKFALVANFFIPPFFVGLNLIDIPLGLYRVIIEWIF